MGERGWNDGDRIISRVLNKLGTLFSVHYAEMCEYRAEIALWAIATTIPLIMMGIWSKAGASGKFSLDHVQMLRYFIAVFMVRQFTIVWAIHHFEWMVVTGRLSPQLLHPIDPGWRMVMMHFGEQGARLPFALVIVGLVFVLYPQALWGNEAQPGVWWPGFGRIAVFVLTCYGVFLLRFFMQYALAMLAFWYERVVFMDGLLYLPYLFLSGMIYPMDVVREALPTWLWHVLLATPFPYMAWFPAAIVIGEDPPLLRGYAVMTAWTVVFYITYRFLWRKGLKHYSAMGA